jgi:hypothetical protein
MVPANRLRAFSTREFLSDFAAQSYQNVSRETFWYDWRSQESYTRKARKLSFGRNLLSGSGRGGLVAQTRQVEPSYALA